MESDRRATLHEPPGATQRSLPVFFVLHSSGAKAFPSLSWPRITLPELSGSLFTSSVKGVRSTTNTVVNSLIHSIIFILLIQALLR